MSTGNRVLASGLAAALLAFPGNATAVIVGTLSARFDDAVRGGGVVAEGASLAGREDGVANVSATITIAGIPAGATVQRALLYWAISGGVDTTATINAVPVTGVLIQATGDTCWGVNNATFRADVTAQVSGNGNYTISGLPSSTVATAADTDGAALVVVYQNPTSPLVRRVMIRDGAITTTGSGDVVSDTFAGLLPPTATAGRFHLVVPDGQAGAIDGNLIFNGTLLGTNQFTGSDGSLMDVKSYNVSIPALLANATWTHTTGSDCLLFETAVLDYNLPQSADLAITKTDGVTTVVAGGPVTYTIVASNPAGPNPLVGGTVSDTFPAALACTWTCVGSAGGTCAAAGAGNINDTVNLPVGGSATYTASCAVAVGATGSLTNTATVSGGPVTDPTPGNNSATDTDTVLPPQVDVSITKTDGQATATPGTPMTYTIFASNAGPSIALGATVVDPVPAGITGATWTCGGSAGGTCSASGSGDINDSVNLPVGGSVTYTLTGTLSSAATGSLSNTAVVTAPVGITDTNPANNFATDTDTLTPQADLSITKTDGQASTPPGTPITYTIVASNAGPSNAPGATVADTIPAVLTGATWMCVGAGGGTCTAAGAGNINDTVDLPAGGSVTYTLTGTISASAAGSLSNTATVTGPGGVADPTPGNNSATDTDTVLGLDYFTVNPCRVVDTRDGAPIGGPVLMGQATRFFAMAGNCGIPATAKAVSINVAVTQPTAAGNVRLFPAGQPVPIVSSINYSVGQTRSNNAVVSLNAFGEIAAFVGQPLGTTVHLIIDVNGYFEY